jgi:hypothetical protein
MDLFLKRKKKKSDPSGSRTWDKEGWDDVACVLAVKVDADVVGKQEGNLVRNEEKKKRDKKIQN